MLHDDPQEWTVNQAVLIGRRIQDARRAAGLSQDDLGEAIGRNRRTIQRIENGKSDPRLSWLLYISQAVGIPLAVLVDTSADAWTPPATPRPRRRKGEPPT